MPTKPKREPYPELQIPSAIPKYDPDLYKARAGDRSDQVARWAGAQEPHDVGRFLDTWARGASAMRTYDQQRDMRSLADQIQGRYDWNKTGRFKPPVGSIAPPEKRTVRPGDSVIGMRRKRKSSSRERRRS
jgi:hypothetical protein